MTDMQKKFAEAGPWDLEPDYLEGVYRDIHWEIRRNPTMGFLLGYINIPIGSKLSLRNSYHEYDDLYYPRGGITYENQLEGIQTYGFDCGHFGQLAPIWLKNGIQDITEYPRTRYVNIKMVKSEIEKMIDSIYARL